MSEPFNPNQFRQQMAGNPPPQGAIPQNMAPAPQPQAVPAQMAPPPQQPVPYQAAPQQIPLHHVPQQPPQQYIAPAPAQQPQMAPQYMPQQPPAYAPPHSHPPHQQPYQAQQASAPVQPQFAPPPMARPIQQGTEQAQEAPAKKGLFNFKKRKAKQAASNVEAGIEGQETTFKPESFKADGLPRLVVFASGLSIGVMATLFSVLMFGGGKAEPAHVKTSVPAAAVQTAQANEVPEMTEEMKAIQNQLNVAKAVRPDN